MGLWTPVTQWTSLHPLPALAGTPVLCQFPQVLGVSRCYLHVLRNNFHSTWIYLSSIKDDTPPTAQYGLYCFGGPTAFRHTYKARYMCSVLPNGLVFLAALSGLLIISRCLLWKYTDCPIAFNGAKRMDFFYA